MADDPIADALLLSLVHFDSSSTFAVDKQCKR